MQNLINSIQSQFNVNPEALASKTVEPQAEYKVLSREEKIDYLAELKAAQQMIRLDNKGQ